MHLSKIAKLRAGRTKDSASKIDATYRKVLVYPEDKDKRAWQKLDQEDRDKLRQARDEEDKLLEDIFKMVDTSSACSAPCPRTWGNAGKGDCLLMRHVSSVGDDELELFEMLEFVKDLGGVMVNTPSRLKDYRTTSSGRQTANCLSKSERHLIKYM